MRVPEQPERRRPGAGDDEPGTAESQPRPTPGAPGRVSGGLEQRALASHRAVPDRTVPGPQWSARAARAVRVLSGVLGVDPAHVVAVPDPERAYGLSGVPEVRLVLREPGRSGRHFEFVPEYGSTERFVLLAPCPGCRRIVPAFAVATLADLGRHLAKTGPPDAEQFASDPAHREECALFRSDLRFTTAHRPAPVTELQRPPRERPGPVYGRSAAPSCGCACSSGGWCGGCGHAGCAAR